MNKWSINVKTEQESNQKIKQKVEKKREQNKKLKKQYERNKQRLLKAERKNYEYIFLIKTQDNWYKMLAHSALIYMYYVTPIAKEKYNEDYKPPKLLADGDFRNKAPIGVLSFKDVAVVKTVMEACGFEQGKVNSEGDGVVVFKLDRKISEEEFWAFNAEEDEKWNKINKIIIPTASFPNLGVDLREATQLYYDVIRKMPKDAKELVGYNTMNLLIRIKAGLFDAEKGYIEWGSFFNFVPKLLAEIQSDVDTMAAARIEDKNVLLRLAEQVVQIENDVSQAKKSYAKQDKRAK